MVARGAIYKVEGGNVVQTEFNHAKYDAWFPRLMCQGLERVCLRSPCNAHKIDFMLSWGKMERATSLE